MSEVATSVFVKALQRQRAGFATRMLAALIDGSVVLGAWFTGLGAITLVGFMFRPGRRLRLPHPPMWLTICGVAVLAVVILASGWATTGRSIGKRVVGLRLMRMSEQGVGWLAAFLRATACVVFPAGLFWVLFSPRNRSLQDIVLGTSVIYDWGLHTSPSQE
jgi:uncharacterized RDD family membrane protein YckC